MKRPKREDSIYYLFAIVALGLKEAGIDSVSKAGVLTGKIVKALEDQGLIEKSIFGKPNAKN